MLDTILSYKLIEIKEAQALLPLKSLEKKVDHLGPVRSLTHSITAPQGPAHRVIAEIKRASPSKGVMREDLDPVEWAKRYQSAGAVAMSVLTDRKFFHGSLEHLVQVRETVNFPLLRKDFMIDPYQIWEARYYGADVVLLIMRILTDTQFKQLLDVTLALGMEALVEVHEEHDLDRALELGARLIGINNRDLKTFTVDIAVTERLMPRIPPEVTVISASGIQTAQQIKSLEDKGVKAFLIGETLVTSSDPEKKLKELIA